MNLTLVTAPAAEPLDLATAKAHLRVTGSSEDALVAGYAAAAVARVEQATRRQLAGAVWEMHLDCFPDSDAFEVPRAPLRSVTWIKYYDTAGTLQTLATTVYQVQAFSGPAAPPGVVSLKENQTWPDTQPIRGAVQIRFEAGYAASGAAAPAAEAAVPKALKQAILLTLGEFYARREDAIAGTIIGSVPLAARALMQPYVVW